MMPCRALLFLWYTAEFTHMYCIAVVLNLLLHILHLLSEKIQDYFLVIPTYGSDTTQLHCFIKNIFPFTNYFFRVIATNFSNARLFLRKNTFFTVTFCGVPNFDGLIHLRIFFENIFRLRNNFSPPLYSKRITKSKYFRKYLFKNNFNKI